MSERFDGELSAEAKLCQAQDALMEALGEEPRGMDPLHPGLREFLNAGMPEWMARAAYTEMEQQAFRAPTDLQYRDNIQTWWRFVRSVARQGNSTTGVRFPPDI